MADWVPAGYLIHAFIFFIGSAIGSFLNVVIYRIPLDLSVVFPASHCPSCKTPVRSYDNLPILSYIRLKGECRSCKAAISIRYPIVEAMTAFAALGSVLWLAATPDAAALFIFFALLFTASLIDFDYQIIPDKITYPAVAIGFTLSFFRSDITWTEGLAGLLVGAGVLMAVRVIGQRIFKKEVMGLGDVKLLALIGVFLGWEASLFSMFLGSILGTLYGIPMLIQESRTGERGDHMIPFGPFLAGGGLLGAILMKTIWWSCFPFQN